MNCRNPLATLLLLPVLLTLSALAHAQWLIRPVRPAIPVRPIDTILVRFRPGTANAGMKRMEQSAAMRAIPILTMQQEHHQIGLRVYRVSDPSMLEQTAARLSRMPEVLYAEPSRRVRLLAVPNDPYFSRICDDPDHVLFPPDSWPYQWPLQFTDAEGAWTVWPGIFYTTITKPRNALRVAIIDTGIDPDHPDFRNAGGISTDARDGGQIDIENARNLLNGGDNPDPTDPTDEYGHGTHVAGIVGAATNNGQGIAALGYTSQLMPIKVIDASGTGSDADVIAGMLWAADHGASIINMSLALDGGYSQALQDAVDYCWTRNVLVVAAAGNDGVDYIRRYPAACNKVLAVGATIFANFFTIPDYEVNASYSNLGLYLGIAAPGGDYSYWNNEELGLVPELYTMVWSTTPTYGSTLSDGGITETTYGFLNGTSMASPHVAGLAALYAGYKNATGTTPTPQQVVRAIQRGADNLAGRTDGGWTTAYGYGRINAGATMREQLGIGRPTTTPGGITGQVTFAQLPVLNASVTATRTGTTIRYSALTKDDGTFRLANVPAGSYSVRCQYQTTVKTVATTVVAGSDTMAMDFEMYSTSGVSVTISPKTVSVPHGGTQAFAAAVSGGTGGVTWSLVDGLGSLTTTGVYTAPTSGTTPALAHVRATSVDDPSKSDTAEITIVPTLSALTLSPTSVVAGGSVTGKVTLSGNTPSGGMTVTLAKSHPAITSMPSSVLVPGGVSTATFTIVTGSVTANQVGTVSATLGAVTKSASLTVKPLTLYSLTLSPTTVAGSKNVTGTVTLTGSALPTDVVVSLSTTNTAATVPASVTILQGTTSRTFTITTVAVSASTSGTVKATLGSVYKTATLTVRPIGVSALTVASNPVKGGVSMNGRVTLEASSAPGNITASLTSSNPAVVSVPATVTVPAGQSSVLFTIVTQPVTAPVSVTLTASANGLSKSVVLKVNPVYVYSVTFTPTPCVGSQAVTGKVTLDATAQAGGVTVALSSSNPAVAAPGVASLSIPPGSTSATFPVSTTPVSANTAVTFTAKANGVSKTGTLTVKAPGVSGLALSPTSLVGGLTATATVTLNGPAPAAGTVVTLSSSNTAAATVPASLTITAGQKTGTCVVTSKPVSANTSSTIKAMANALYKTAVLSVKAPGVTSLVLSPNPAKGGTAVTGTVTLQGPAGPLGQTVTLSSSNTLAATVPTSIVVSAGQTTGTFPVTTKVVAANASATIKATANTIYKTALLTVTP